MSQFRFTTGDRRWRINFVKGINTLQPFARFANFRFWVAKSEGREKLGRIGCRWSVSWCLLAIHRNHPRPGWRFPEPETFEFNLDFFSPFDHFTIRKEIAHLGSSMAGKYNKQRDTISYLDTNITSITLRGMRFLLNLVFPYKGNTFPVCWFVSRSYRKAPSLKC